MEWQPIETAPVNSKSDYFFCLAAWGENDDKHTGFAMRYKDEWFASSVFYNMQKQTERQYTFREHKITPTHWMPGPEWQE